MLSLNIFTVCTSQQQHNSGNILKQLRKGCWLALFSKRFLPFSKVTLSCVFCNITLYPYKHIYLHKYIFLVYGIYLAEYRRRGDVVSYMNW